MYYPSYIQPVGLVGDTLIRCFVWNTTDTSSEFEPVTFGSRVEDTVYTQESLDSLYL